MVQPGDVIRNPVINEEIDAEAMTVSRRNLRDHRPTLDNAEASDASCANCFIPSARHCPGRKPVRYERHALTPVMTLETNKLSHLSVLVSRPCLLDQHPVDVGCQTYHTGVCRPCIIESECLPRHRGIDQRQKRKNCSTSLLRHTSIVLVDHKQLLPCTSCSSTNNGCGRTAT